MPQHPLLDLFEDRLKDLFSAENQLLKALPQMAKKASSESLKEAFETHLGETEEHVSRLESLGERLGIKLSGKKCHGMEGLIKEGREAMSEDGDPAVIDAALIGAAQAVEHYEVAGYGTARAIAESLGEKEIVEILQETLDEEGAADKKLTDIAQGEILPEAVTTVGSEHER